MTISQAFQKTLIICGIVSSMLFVAVDIIASNKWPGYSIKSQAFSELTAIEAPTRPLMVITIGIPYNLLTIAFSIGIWITAFNLSQKRALRFLAAMIFVHAVSGFIGGTIFPMHSRGMVNRATITDTLHIISTAVEVLSMMLAIGFGAAAFGKAFRRYSILTILLLAAGGARAAMYAQEVANNQATPGLGIVERINIYGFMLWVIVLSLMLLRRQTDRAY
jgi:hypothetical membrane protein